VGRKAAADEEPGDGGGHGADLGLVASLSLLAGGLASYPSLSAVADGKGDVLHAVTIFLTASLVAMVGLGLVALLFHSFTAAHGEREAATGGSGDGRVGAGDASPEGSGPLSTIGREMDDQAHEIDDALAPTDALLHRDRTNP
jgi:hypothetical protein